MFALGRLFGYAFKLPSDSPALKPNEKIYEMMLTTVCFSMAASRDSWRTSATRINQSDEFSALRIRFLA